MKVSQKILERIKTLERTSRVNKGVMRFHDSIHYEPYTEFINRVTFEANELLEKKCKILSISHPSENLAVISYLEYNND